MTKKIKFKYGDENLSLNLPPYYQILETKDENRKIKWEKKIKLSFRKSIGSPVLVDIVKSRQPQDVVIIVNDITRPVRYDLVLEPMLKELKAAGMADDDILLLIATGMHREMTKKEVKNSLGEEIAGNYRWKNHNCDQEMISFGEIESDIPLDVNPAIVQADLVLAVGVIAPHYMAGYSGGRKSLLPGVCGRNTIEAHHSLMTSPGSRTANLEDNPFHETMIEAVEKVGLDFIANVVVNSRNEAIDVVTGHYRKAWERGVEKCSEKSVINIDKPGDAVLVSAGGFPKDINMYQAQKALENASYCVKEEAPIILIAECKEGLGEDTFENWINEARSPESLEDKIKRNFELGGHKAYAVSQVAKNHKIFLYSSLNDELVTDCFMHSLQEVQDINNYISSNFLEEELIYIMPHGANTVPSLNN